MATRTKATTSTQSEIQDEASKKEIVKKTSAKKKAQPSKKETTAKTSAKKVVKGIKQKVWSEKKTTKSTIEKTAIPASEQQDKSVKEVDSSTTTKTSSDSDKNKSSPKPQTMEELLKMTGYEPVVPKKGEKIKGKIIEKTNKMIKLDINFKSYGVVGEQEFEFAQDFIQDLKVKKTIEATVVAIESNRGQVTLSLKGAASDAKWEFFEDALNNETTLEAKGIEANKGGLIVVVNGIRGFVPSSQFSRRYLDHIEELVDQKFQIKAVEVDRERNRLIFSERHVSEEKQLSQREQALSVVKEGNVYEGVISGVKAFGLFMTVEVPIDGSDLSDKIEDGELKPEHRSKDALPSESIGYVEGLIHISEISWEKVDHPKNYHQVGDRVLVKVLGVDEGSGKLNLSIKRLKLDPWKKAAQDYPSGTTFQGTVSRIEPFGIFVNVMPGVDGLIHASKISPDSNLNKGDKITVNVDNVEPDKRRMSLSLVLTEVPIGYK